MAKLLLPVAFAGTVAIAQGSLDGAKPEPLQAITPGLYSRSGSEWPAGRSGANRSIAFHRCKHTLLQAVNLAEQGGGSAICAAFEERGGTLVVRVEIAKGADEGRSRQLLEFVANATTPEWKPAVFPYAIAPTASQLHSRCMAAVHSKLCLTEAITLAECLTSGDVQAITPIRQGGQILFLTEILMRSGELVSALLDPDTCDFTTAVLP